MAKFLFLVLFYMFITCTAPLAYAASDNFHYATNGFVRLSTGDTPSKCVVQNGNTVCEGNFVTIDGNPITEYECFYKITSDHNWSIDTVPVRTGLHIGAMAWNPSTKTCRLYLQYFRTAASPG